MEYKDYELGELIEYRNEKLLIENVSLENYISTENLLPYRRGKQNAEKLPNTKSVKKYYENDILISNIRPYFKKIWHAEFPGGASNDVLILNSCSNNITNDYLYYYLSQSKFFDYMTQTAKGTKMPRGDKKAILRYKIIVPNLKYIQDYIVNIGKNIDNKIELNKKIIANLEELSQTLFKRWFVDFEFPDENGNPYKSSGGEMVDSELGMVPKGWKILELGKITEIIMGQSPKSDTYNTQNEGLPLLNGATDFKDRILNATKYTTDPKKRGQIGDYVFGVRATVGLVTELDRDYAIGRGAAVARVESTHKEWLYEILVKSFQYFENSISGSVYINISSNDLNNYKVIYPSTEIMYKYHDKLVSIFDLVKSVKLETNLLTLLRDTLLPKLMSGEIEIPDDIEVMEDELSI
ncbi:restriction endonuclease subunit S [Staphylococcus chromogenes]|uniref:restriction endonuclease subunit S n=1 Tax=Staphylococcus chromogenes TaxID=46126 RepID=UPI000D02E24B|nr:restriction endonuclease subunit S [Staphylococcus chromogenes]